MNVFHLIAAELKEIFSKPRHIEFMLAVMCIPLLYAGIFLYGFWNAYGNSGNLPVAVVNQDQGAKISGKQINAGKDLVNELKKNHNLKWTFVSSKQAESGFKNNHYFMTVSISADFSKNATTLVDQQLKPANIHYQVNKDYNFVSSKMVASGLQQMKASVSSAITKTYAQTMYRQLNQLTQGMQKAADGVGTLSSGSKKELAGLNQLKSGYKVLADGTGKVQSGANQLADGASSLNDGLKQAASGTTKLYNRTSANSSNIAKLADGASTLADKLDQLNKGAAQLSNGSGQLTGGSQSLTSGMNQYLAGLNQFQQGMIKEKTGLDQLNQQLSESQPQIDKLVSGVSQLNSGASQLNSGINQLAPVAHQVSEGVTALASAANQMPSSENLQMLQGNANNLNDGIAQVLGAQPSSETVMVPRQLLDNMTGINKAVIGIKIPSFDAKSINQLQTGASSLDQAFNTGINGQPSLKSAASSLSSGLSTLNNSTSAFSSQNQKLAAGVAQLATGMNQLSSGQQALQSNFIKLVDGEARISSGMATLQSNLSQIPGATKALGSGATQLAEGNIQMNRTWPQLVNGIQSLQSGTNQLVTGSNKLATNMNSLSSGISGLASGQQKLASGTNQAASGAQQLSNGNSKLAGNLSSAHAQLAKTPTNNAHAQKFSSPVTTIDGTHQAVNTFGSGFTPYFMCIGLFLGALLLTIVYDLYRPAGLATAGWNIALSKFFITILMSVAQAFLVDLAMIKGLGLQISDPWAFFGFTILLSMSFMAIITWLAGSFNNEGRFAAIVLLLFQLVTCGGAYSIQLIPHWLQALSPLLPFTYGVNGLRNLIDGHQQQMLAQNSMALVVFILIGVGLMIITYTIKFNREQAHRKASRNYGETLSE